MASRCGAVVCLVILIGGLNLIGIFFISLNAPRLRSLEPSHPETPPLPLAVSNPLVGVVIRAHDGYKQHLISLLWGLLSQTYKSDVKVIIVPTESPSISILTQYLHDHWFNDSADRILDLSVAPLDSDLFLSHCCDLQNLCTEEWQTKKFLEGYPDTALQRYCEVNSPLHYHLTDFGLKSVLFSCPSCQYLLVTNADNSYSPTYLQETIERMEADHLDLILTDMIHLGKPMTVEPELGKMDLGCALIRIAFLKEHEITFVSSIPSPAEPQHWHDADYWLLEMMKRKGARISTLSRTLFVHN
jgi:hypothetical protein